MTAQSSKNFASKTSQGLVVLLIAALFFSLGIWQLDRAKALKKSLAVATHISVAIVPLQSITKSREALPAQAINRWVKFSGHYVADFKAPNQVDGDGKLNDWEVGLLQIGSNEGILVVRGLWSERLLNPDISQAMVIDIQGQLLAHQYDDHSVNGDGSISRLDSSVVVGLTDLDLFDGYVLASAESHKGEKLIRQRPTPEKLSSRIPGFYWQHLSYVVIWWLMAGVVLYLPFYRRRVAS
ncbi:MAG: SURF1 family cytochrome oxidase biogenesis protein [Actinomycetes bacterium]